VNDALAAGYRSIDTAAAYQNEEAVGHALAKSGLAVQGETVRDARPQVESWLRRTGLLSE
jgi:diketogulonate reductase-like aldo/keto reductase